MVDSDLRVGHVVGVTYNVRIQVTGDMCNDELLDRTIPLIKWVDGTTSGIHHNNIELYK